MRYRGQTAPTHRPAGERDRAVESTPARTGVQIQETMKERVKQFVADKRGVSPVIGVMNASRYSSDYMKVR